MQQTQLARAVRLDARTLRRLLKLVRIQLAHLPRPTVPLALSVPHLPSIPHLPLESLSLLPSALQTSLQTSLQTHLPSVSAETITWSLRSLSGASQRISLPINLNLDTTALQALLTRLVATVHTRLPAALARSVPSDPDLLRAAVHKLAITQARSHAIRYGIQVALGFTLRLLPEVGRSLPVPLRLALSLARLAVRQAIGQAVRVIVGMAMRQAVAARLGVSLGKRSARVVGDMAKPMVAGR
ncbi:hypothetical protein CcaverHIS002_0200680 [Cutaneotrichosporon cavernicola]|uniref:Uncharacterized protein n=1 Tax=Cutaneotrichosporon cavernicola TaxID=279322 RepID=A0AA48ID26_9TREE|nr:uncharacterized protein CcaverHIS019_0200730 [Cutaneotrichosporon cavernicola]BEI80908.1 hypothetical protein CcaverHIS002_0200680 [Cutaneotrichosporon cavernicola]BEI88711.1 hypothetical protein CcaverHIS019_0200730 [Cutaneotrichosporon cavernicola]BEI96485.1 hypothetical protein CcaverHIS631_0200740 [Cutaneotrichosporon cavernicola]BEJ04256.1 hypothetical protein CcaverHIS641_0200730 [Cutaneotrichosporon cavernicola]